MLNKDVWKFLNKLSVRNMLIASSSTVYVKFC